MEKDRYILDIKSNKTEKIHGKIEKFFDFIKKTSAGLSNTQPRHISLLIQGSTILNIGFSSKTYSWVIQHKSNSVIDWPATRHAECDSILNIDRKIISKCDVVVARLNKKNKLMLSKPCNMCCKVLKDVGIKRIFYSIDEENFGIIKL